MEPFMWLIPLITGYRYSRRMELSSVNGELGVKITGEFEFIIAIDVDSDGFVYVLDQANFNIQNSPRKEILVNSWGSQGSGEGQFLSPAGIAIHGNQYVYVTDSQGYRVSKFDTDGNFISQWGSQGSTPGKFRILRGIEVDTSGNVYLADEGNICVQKFTGDGTYLLQWGIGLFNGPQDIAVDPDGNIHVLDTYQGIQKFTPTGSFICQGMDDDQGFSEGQFNSPRGITIDEHGNIFVMDTFNQRALVFYNDVVEDDSRTIQIEPAFQGIREVSNLEINGSFEVEPALSDWTYGGVLPVSRSTNAYTGDFSLLLAEPTPATPIGPSYAWAHNTVYIPTGWENP